MAHTGTSVGLAKQPATGFGPMLLTAIIVLAIGVGVVAATWFLATPNRGVGVPTADHSYDQIENLRGAAIFSAAGDHSYDAIETHRAAGSAVVQPAAVGRPGLGPRLPVGDEARDRACDPPPPDCSAQPVNPAASDATVDEGRSHPALVSCLRGTLDSTTIQ